MAAPVLTLISPVAGAPGTAITLAGTGFAAGARVGCPALVPAAFVSSTQLTAVIPSDIVGPEGGTMAVAVFVLNPDGGMSGTQLFTVQFPRTALQTWTTVELVCAEVPEFVRNTRVDDATILNWMRSIAQTVCGVMLKRGMSLDALQWATADAGSALPSPAGVLEQIVRLGAAARLASVISGNFSAGGEWGLATNLTKAFAGEMKMLGEGVYDKLFLPSAATVNVGPSFSGGNVTTKDGCSTQAFRKQEVF